MAGNSTKPVEETEQAKEMRYLALGDSYTVGEGVDEAQSWPVQLAAALHQHGACVAEPVIIAQTGWTTDELMVSIQQKNPGGRFELVSLLIGVNNQYQGRGMAEYRTQFRALLLKAIDFAAGEADHTLVLSIPDWGVTPFAEGQDRRRIAAEIDRFNAVNREEAQELGARYVDVTSISRQAITDPVLIAVDGLHLSGKMYQLWVQLILPEALAALGKGVGDAVCPIDEAMKVES
jgi:acyl-CoA thioesterase-1